MLFVAPLSLCAQKFAHFDYGTIMQAMPEFKTAQASIEALGKQYQSEIEGMQKELQTKAEKYQKEDTDATPANIKERHQQELQDMYQRLQQAQQDNTEKFQQPHPLLRNNKAYHTIALQQDNSHRSIIGTQTLCLCADAF